MELNNMSLGQRIQKARENNHLTQTELGVKVHKTQQQILKYENNKSMPPVNTLVLLADTLGLTLDSLVHEQKDEDGWDNIIAAAATLDESDQKTLKKIIKGLKVVQESEKY